MPNFLITLSPYLAQGSVNNPGGGTGSSNNPPPTSVGKLPNPLEGQTIQIILERIAQFAIGLGILVAVLVIIYAAYLMLTAGANPGRFEEGKKTIIYAVAGLAVLLLSYVIVNTVLILLGANPLN